MSQYLFLFMESNVILNSTDFDCMDKCFWIFFQNIFFCVPQKKESRVSKW